MASPIVSQSVCSPVVPTNPPRPHASVYEIITSQILAELERGQVPWRKPWRADLPLNLISGKPYRGINVFLLASQGYESRYWVTLNQANKLGGRVKPGEHSTLVTFWHIGEEKTVRQADGSERKQTPFLLRYYRVFNVCQTEGIADQLGLGNTAERVPSIELCEIIADGMPNRPAKEQSDRAWYRPSTDTVGMPARGLFNSLEEYYSTLFHELTHSTRHPSRIGREGIERLNTFGSELYSREELIAEMGAAMLCGITGIASRTLDNSAAYLQSWLSVLKSDSRMVVTAASAAQKGRRLHRWQVSGSWAGRPMSRPTPHGIAEFPLRQNSGPKIKAPFLLRTMNHPGMPQMIWVWCRRGKRWTSDQVLSFDLTQNRELGDS